MKRLLIAFALATAAFAQIREGVNGSSAASVQVGRNRSVVESAPAHPGAFKAFLQKVHLAHRVPESRLPGQHNLVTIVGRHPKAGCLKTEECGEIFYNSLYYNLVVKAVL